MCVCVCACGVCVRLRVFVCVRVYRVCKFCVLQLFGRQDVPTSDSYL